MGVPREQATRNRQAIIEAASRAFRERGVDAVCVADLMKEAGFTHGGFYNHFASKDALAAECCAASLAQATAHLLGAMQAGDDGEKNAFHTLLEAYLSPAQRDAPGLGCPTATLAIDAARHGEEMQAAYAAGIAAFLDVIQTYLAAHGEALSPHRADAVALLINLVGTIVLARGVGAANPGLSEEILAVGRARLPP